MTLLVQHTLCCPARSAQERSIWHPIQCLVNSIVLEMIAVIIVTLIKKNKVISRSPWLTSVFIKGICVLFIKGICVLFGERKKYIYSTISFHLGAGEEWLLASTLYVRG